MSDAHQIGQDIDCWQYAGKRQDLGAKERTDGLHLRDALGGTKRKPSPSLGKSFLSSGTDLSGADLKDKLTQANLDRVNEKRKRQGINDLYKIEDALHMCVQNEPRSIRVRSGSPKNLKLKYPSIDKKVSRVPVVTKYGQIHKDKIQLQSSSASKKMNLSNMSGLSASAQNLMTTSYNSVYKHHNRVSTIKTELTNTLARLRTPNR